MEKLIAGDLFPEVSLDIASGQSLKLPTDLDAPLTIMLFYRGYWWPYCIRQLNGYNERRAAFAGKGATIIAAVADSKENTLKVAETVDFPIAYGVTKEQAEILGSWWSAIGPMEFIQPSEFVLANDGKVIAATYSHGPFGRMDPTETLTYISREAFDSLREDYSKDWAPWFQRGFTLGAQGYAQIRKIHQRGSDLMKSYRYQSVYP